ncbi:DUF1127 domain-containing protein [Mesobaculum littorinae]|uniref:DUF1127 domain-containing protein n=1 Tax=Mesobaculum littorinae TaxID=2486419 RepID=A0A438AK97_9RHOB|nr:DUF1127 domain-containing protein [Mesobaculum littorinae]RVV99079.1 DUF1127 domain-containing protein [Mesobaculum littorinae]
MAFVSASNNFETGATQRASAAIRSVRQRMAQYRVYRETLSELDALSNRELADLGLGRSMIRRVALEAAYGQ